jgi:hypothetical protein
LVPLAPKSGAQDAALNTTRPCTRDSLTVPGAGRGLRLLPASGSCTPGEHIGLK